MKFIFGVLIWVLGIICGIVVAYLIKSDGVLKIDHSNPAKDVYRFEIDDLYNLKRKKKILLKIDHHADLSQN